MSLNIFRMLLLGYLALFPFALIYGQQGQSAPKLRPIQQNGKWGYIDSTGKIIIKPQFYWAEEFSEGLADFENEDGRHGYVDETGKIVIEPIFDRTSKFSEGLAAVAIDLQWGFIDRTGKWVIPQKFSYADSFNSGLAYVQIPVSGKATFPPGEEKHAFIDKTGKVVIAPDENILNGRYSNGFAAVHFYTQKSFREVIIDKTGKVIFTADKPAPGTFSGGSPLGDFSEGLAPVKKGGKWGYIDANGQFVIQPQFEDAKSFSEGLAGVMIKEKWGYINREGKLVIPSKYEFAYEGEHSFSEGLALVYLNDDCAYINNTGKAVIKFKCDKAYKFAGGLAYVEIGEKRAYLNKQGKFVWGPEGFKYKSLEEVRAQVEKRIKDEEVLTPLTDEERALNPRDVVLNQPDFVADLSFFYSEGFGGLGGGHRVARKGNRYREESEHWLFIGVSGKRTARVFPNSKTYDDFEPVRDELPGGASSFNPKSLGLEQDVTFTALGTVELNGYKCIKIEATRKDRPDEKIYLYAARELKDLIIVGQVRDKNRGLVQKLSNISFDVPESLVEIPSDYKPIQHDRWTKVETAKVAYGGKPSKDFGVFRSPTGELFVWIKDAPYSWEYLVRPKEATVETAFQGMLVTPSGKYIWRTNETEAYSTTYYRNKSEERKKENEVIVKSNSVKFRSNDYDKDKAMIEVTW